MAMKYINHFAINEDDQFEIAAIKTIDKDTMPLEFDQAIEAAENLTKLQIEHSSSDESCLGRKPFSTKKNFISKALFW